MALSPVPIPMAIRPGAISSSESSAAAVTDGSRDSGLVTEVMIRALEVCSAQSAATTYSSRTSAGESGRPITSTPASSASFHHSGPLDIAPCWRTFRAIRMVRPSFGGDAER